MCNPMTSRARCNDTSSAAVNDSRPNNNRHTRDVEMGDTSQSAAEPASPSSEDIISTQPLLKRAYDDNGTPSKSRTGHYNDHDAVGSTDDGSLDKHAATSSSFSSSSSKNISQNDTGFGSAFLNTLPPTQQMILLSFLMFLFFGMHNVLQEAIVQLLNLPPSSSTIDPQLLQSLKSDGTIMLGYAEVTGVLAFSYLERVHIAKERGLSHVAPLRAYPLLTLCLFASSSLCNMSLSYINFPTKVVFRSCKLVPTMIIATMVNKKTFASYEYVCALAICAGLVLFALADYRLDPMKFDVLGLALVSGSVVADAILPNAQERLFRHGSSRLEVTVFSNLFSFVAMTVVTGMSGTLLNFAKLMYLDRTVALYVGVYTVLSYVSISCYMTLVKRFGGVAAVLLTTARKAMTLVLSFLLFPKGFSWLYVHGSLLVLGAVMVASIFKKMGIGQTKGNNGSVGNEGTTNKDGVEKLSPLVKRADSTASIKNEEAEAILSGISKRVYV